MFNVNAMTAGAADGGRTRTLSPDRDFKSLVSANFTTAANKMNMLKFPNNILIHGADNQIRTGTPNLEGWYATITSYLHGGLKVTQLHISLHIWHKTGLPYTLTQRPFVSNGND